MSDDVPRNRLDLGPAVPAPLQRAVAAALAWVDALDREVEAPTRSGFPPRDSSSDSVRRPR